MSLLKKKKNLRCSYVQKKRGEIFIKNSEWVYISIKKNYHIVAKFHQQLPLANFTWK